MGSPGVVKIGRSIVRKTGETTHRPLICVAFVLPRITQNKG